MIIGEFVTIKRVVVGTGLVIKNGEIVSVEKDFVKVFCYEDNKELKVSVIEEIDIDKILARPYKDGVPPAFSEGLFSTYSSGWGFKNGTVLATGNSQGFGLPISIKLEDQVISPVEATWMPSHVTSVFDSSKSFANIASEATVSASFTSQYDTNGIAHLTDGTVSYSDSPRNRWSNYSNPVRTQNEYITLDFAKAVTCSYFTVYFFDDEGNTRLPKAVSVQYYDGSKWITPKNLSCEKLSRNTSANITFDEVQTKSIRLVLTPQSGKAMGITEVKLFGVSEKSSVIPSGTSHIILASVRDINALSRPASSLALTDFVSSIFSRLS